jgi:predicted extracellular nuclease
LLQRNAHSIRNESFQSDAEQLIATIRNYLTKKRETLDIPALDDTEYYIAWWNVENLFDGIYSKEQNQSKNKKLFPRHWSNEIKDRKIEQLVKIIAMMNRGQGPDLLGIAEIENEKVLKQLAGQIQGKLKRNYSVCYSQDPNKMFLDLAFIFDQDRLSLVKTTGFSTLLRTPGINILMAEFETYHGAGFTAFANHWPPQSGGTTASEPYRVVTAENLSFLIQKNLTEKANDWPLLIMGDFSDEPYSKSLVDYLLASRNEIRVLKSRNPMLYNLTWPFMAQNQGTFSYYNESLLFDQIMVSAGFLKKGARLRIKKSAEDRYIVRIGMFKDIVQKDGSPRGFGGGERPIDQNGFSDHFPVMTIIEESVRRK